MVKMVLSDYWESRKENYRKIVKQDNSWAWIYLFIIPIQQVIIWDDINIWIVYSELLPIILGNMISLMYPARLSKVLYLCPMGQEDRQQYIRTAYRVRVGLIMFIWLIVNLLMLPFGGVPLIELLLGGMRVLLYALAVNVCLKVDHKHEAYKRLNIGCCNACWMLAYFTGIIGAFADGICIGGEFYIGLGEWIFIAILMVAQLIIALIAVGKYKNKVMDLAMDYELIEMWQEAK